MHPTETPRHTLPNPETPLRRVSTSPFCLRGDRGLESLRSPVGRAGLASCPCLHAARWLRGHLRGERTRGPARRSPRAPSPQSRRPPRRPPQGPSRSPPAAHTRPASWRVMAAGQRGPHSGREPLATPCRGRAGASRGGSVSPGPPCWRPGRGPQATLPAKTALQRWRRPEPEGPPCLSLSFREGRLDADTEKDHGSAGHGQGPGARPSPPRGLSLRRDPPVTPWTSGFQTARQVLRGLCHGGHRRLKPRRTQRL